MCMRYKHGFQWWKVRNLLDAQIIMQLSILGYMKRKTFSGSPCQIARSLDVLGDWWNPLILRECTYCVHRFDEFHQWLGIGRNILTRRLSQLVSSMIRLMFIRSSVQFWLPQKDSSIAVLWPSNCSLPATEIPLAASPVFIPTDAPEIGIATWLLASGLVQVLVWCF